MRAIEVPEYGDASVLTSTDKEVPEPGPGELRIAVEAAGINFADIMQRRGQYPGGPEPPYVPGMEAAGSIDAIGDGVDRSVGDRVVAMTTGGYAEYAIAPAGAVFDVPVSMSSEEAAGFPVQFLTAYSALFTLGDLTAEDSVLIHAAAGGVGTAATQLAANASATVFGTASTSEKLELADKLGVDHPINYTEVAFDEKISNLTDQHGVDLILDGVGGETTTESFDCLSPFGTLVAFGAASGQPGTVDTGTILFNNASVYGFHLGQSMQHDPERILQSVPELTELLLDGKLSVIVGETFDLSAVGAAHEYIEDRRSVGKVVLQP
ncbi:quinone oxidoreductase family protein [Halocatena halophila]|uniref:quinone oxidoreductase family protein n=1 Tax=Halocatena halophila TaxID=2814576 RepID=UPI002ED66111